MLDYIKREIFGKLIDTVSIQIASQNPAIENIYPFLGYLFIYYLTFEGVFSELYWYCRRSLRYLSRTKIEIIFYTKLNEYKMLLAVACICYEAREKTEFFKNYPSKSADELKRLIWKNEYLAHEKRFREIESLTSLMHLLYHGQSLLKILENTNLQEGDVIRFFRQIVDRLGQIKSATQDKSLRDMISSCQKLVDDCLGEFDTL